MPRKRLIRIDHLPYHITARANNREPFHGDLTYVWKVLTNELYLQQLLYQLQIHAFVLMPNHFHLLVTCPDRGIDLVMKEILGSSTRILNTRYQRSGHVFGGRYSWSLIKEPDYYAHALKYVIRNPVKAGLCPSVCDYEFSTFSGLMGQVPLPVPISTPIRQISRLVPGRFEDLEVWFNEPHPAEQNEAIRKALRRKEFRFFAGKARRAPNFKI